MLILLSFSMFFGSYLSGIIPTVINFSESKVRLLSILGAGILVGTSLVVIIPEGVNSIYGEFFLHKKLKLKLPSRSISTEELPHSLIGTCLLVGFVFMLLVDQIASRHSSTSNYSSLPTDSEIGQTQLTSQIKRKSSSKITATIGLIFHASADGIALGAATSTHHRDVEMVIFLAIMLHKSPASFSLVTFLIHEGLDKKSIRRHLIYFSLSAPISAFVTYALLRKISAESIQEYNATGIAMLFSAGTFLFVVQHVLQETTHDKQLKLKELIILVFGCFLPSILTINHHH